MSQSMLEVLVFFVLLGAALFIGSRAKKGDVKAQKTAKTIAGILSWILNYWWLWGAAILLLANWYYGKYM